MSPKEKRYGSKIASKIYFIKQLDCLGVDKKYLGYYLLIEIMELLINQDVRVYSFSKNIYPIIAEKYGKTPCTIERNIRSLIEKCWNRDMMEKLEVYYVDDRKPTCREFVFLVKKFVTKNII